jgi:hypothetical protein
MYDVMTTPSVNCPKAGQRFMNGEQPAILRTVATIANLCRRGLRADHQLEEKSVADIVFFGMKRNTSNVIQGRVGIVSTAMVGRGRMRY